MAADYSEFERAAIKACDGFPTAWLDRGFVKEMYATMALITLADKVGERRGLDIIFPASWWRAHVRGQIDALNQIALSDQSYRAADPDAGLPTAADVRGILKRDPSEGASDGR